MRFVTFRDHTGVRAGVLDGTDHIHPFAPGEQLVDLLGEDGRLQASGAAALARSEGVVELDSVHLMAPVPNPPTIRDFMTFESHFQGCRGPDNPIPAQWYDAPAFYFTNPYAVIGPSDPVPVPPGCSMFDLELEVAAVVGSGGRDLDPEHAESHIAGYTILVDWSARDLQINEMQVGLGPAKGKDTATTLGPVLVSADELEQYRHGTSFAIGMSAEINGQPLGNDRLDSMAFSFGEMIAYASRGTEVRPGDVLGSGTCGGGCLAEMWGRYGFDNHPALKPGDTVSVAVEGIGSMSLEVVAGSDLKPIAPARARSA
jgi:2-keto-4-pentenoate hydratase/2-oxohepta-3-ene-1,7-dioic acid hydratase in catechol pathway